MGSYSNVCDFLTEVAKGTINQNDKINKFGHNPDIDTGSDPEDIWEGGGIYACYPATAQTTTIVSTDAQDDITGGTGAGSVKVFGLNGDFEEVSETVFLSGATAVTLVNTYTRVYRAIVTGLGAGGTASGTATNAGTITIAAGGTTCAIIAIGHGQTQQAIYTVPAGKRALLYNVYASIPGTAASKKAIITLRAREPSGVFAVKHQFSLDNAVKPDYSHDFSIPIGPFPAQTDILVRCETVTANDTEIAAGFDLLLVDS